MRSVILLAAAVAGPATAQGPISKFDSRPPIADYVSSAKMEDIERCLIDMRNQPIPYVYRQPDRPDEVQLFWIVEVTVDARLDLRRVPTGTHVRSWMSAKQALACAPPAK